MNQELELFFTNNLQTAQRLTDEGCEPIECAFGDQTVLGELCMDHHGSESWREGVALRACRDHYGARRHDPRFVVTGTPDADAILAIIALSAAIPKEKLLPDFYELVNLHDTDPIGMNLLDEASGEELLFFQQIEMLRRDSTSFYRAFNVMKELLENGLSSKQREQIRKKESNRIRLAEECLQEKIGEHILLVKSKVWGFDRWYIHHPVVVSFASRIGVVTIGCKQKDVAEQLFGKGGLLNVFPLLGDGWGGRESIGGSPRGKKMTYQDAYQVAQSLSDILKK